MSVGYGTRISGLIRDCMVAASASRHAYREFEQLVQNFVDPRLKQADTLVTDEGQMYTKNGQMGTVANISWTIVGSMGDYYPDGVDYLSEAMAVIDLVAERLPQENDWLELLDGTCYYRCYPLPDGGLLVPDKLELSLAGTSTIQPVMAAGKLRLALSR